MPAEILMILQRLPHLLLYGPPGTGKTSTILALARRIYGAKNMRQMVLELNASDDRGIDVVREQIKTFASKTYPILVLTNSMALTEDFHRYQTDILHGPAGYGRLQARWIQIDHPR